MFRPITKRFIKSRLGQSMVEFALIMPIMVFLIGGMATGGQMLLIKLSMQMSVYEGARAGVTQANLSAANTESTNKIKTFLGSNKFINTNAVSVTSNAPSGWTKGSEYYVKAQYSVTPIFPVPGIWDKGSSTNMSVDIRMSIENGT